MRVLSASWDGEEDLTKIKFSEEFKTANWIVKADVLKDLIGMLDHQYHTLIQQHFDLRDDYKFDIPHPADI